MLRVNIARSAMQREENVFRNFIYLFITASIVSMFAIGCATATPASTVAQPTAAAPTNVPAPANASGSSDASVSPSESGATIVTLVAVPGKSQANYRVTEQLAGQNLPNDAVGVTDQLSGQIIGKTDGTIVSADSKFVVDLTTLKSDQSMRDGFIQRETLRTSQYPNATFVPTATSGLPATLPPTGPVTFQLMGDLTIRDVTKPVTWEVNCTPTTATEGTCHATTQFTFDDFGIPQPSVPRVLGIEDTITLEVDVALQVSS
ncbi:MAG: hypothetical protein HDKAJFGB_00104 [Anaerolineae bacterium]|nr:hypothetical protein [Anaerolineae bacterium]